MSEYEKGYGKPPKEHQFKKGQSGNPEGARAHDPLKRAIKKLTKEEVLKIIERIMNSTKAEIEAQAKDPNATGLELMIAAVVAKCVSKGDYKALESLLDRKIGKVPQELDLDIDAKLTERRVIVMLPDNGRR